MQTKAAPISKTDKTQLLAVTKGIESFYGEVKTLIADLDGMGTGSLGPDQVKEILSGVGSNLQAILQKVNQVVQGVPAGEGGDGGEDQSPAEGNGGDENQMNAAESEVGLEKNHEKPAPRKTVSEEQPEAPTGGRAGAQSGDKLRDMVASEVNKIVAAKEAKEKLANEAAALMPLHLRQAKYDEFMSSTEDVKILAAKLEGMKFAVRAKTASTRNLQINPKKYPLLTEAGIGQREASMGNSRGFVTI